MLKVIEVTPEEYEFLTPSFPTHLLQTQKWSKVKTYGWETMRLSISEDDKVLAIAMVYLRKLPLLGFRLAYIPRGIAINYMAKLNEVIGAIKTHLEKLNVSFILLEPDNPELTDEYNTAFREALELNKFKPFTDSIQPNTSNVLNIGNSEEEILANMRSKTRQYIRKAEKLNIEVREGTREDIKKFYDVLKQIQEAKGYMWHDLGYYESIWDIFSPNAHLFLAYLDGKIVGSIFTLTSGEWVYEMYGGSNEYAKSLKIPYFFKWKIIKYFHDQRYKYYDQWGTDLKYKGLMQFKSGFGGTPVNYLKQYVYVKSSLAFVSFRLMNALKNIWVNLMKKPARN